MQRRVRPHVGSHMFSFAKCLSTAMIAVAAQGVSAAAQNACDYKLTQVSKTWNNAPPAISLSQPTYMVATFRYQPNSRSAPSWTGQGLQNVSVFVSTSEKPDSGYFVGAGPIVGGTPSQYDLEVLFEPDDAQVGNAAQSYTITATPVTKSRWTALVPAVRLAEAVAQAGSMIDERAKLVATPLNALANELGARNCPIKINAQFADAVAESGRGQQPVRVYLFGPQSDLQNVTAAGTPGLSLAGSAGAWQIQVDPSAVSRYRKIDFVIVSYKTAAYRRFPEPILARNLLCPDLELTRVDNALTQLRTILQDRMLVQHRQAEIVAHQLARAGAMAQQQTSAPVEERRARTLDAYARYSEQDRTIPPVYGTTVGNKLDAIHRCVQTSATAAAGAAQLPRIDLALKAHALMDQAIPTQMATQDRVTLDTLLARVKQGLSTLTLRIGATVHSDLRTSLANDSAQAEQALYQAHYGPLINQLHGFPSRTSLGVADNALAALQSQPDRGVCTLCRTSAESTIKEYGSKRTASIAASAPGVTLRVGEARAPALLGVTVRNQHGEEIPWRGTITSGDAGVLPIDPSGVARAIAPGTTKLTFTMDDKTLQIDVTVIPS